MPRCFSLLPLRRHCASLMPLIRHDIDIAAAERYMLI